MKKLLRSVFAIFLIAGSIGAFSSADAIQHGCNVKTAYQDC